MESNITADIKFAILPEWVLAADISDRAVRMYAILARYADNETLQAFPSRETLAKRAGCNAKAVTKAVEELVAIGAVTKTHRKNGEAYQSNIYTLRRVGPNLTPPRVNSDTRVGSNSTPGRVSDDLLTITTQLEPKELEPLNDISTKFDQFWEIYPRKVGKGKARQAFEKALEKTDIDTILDGVEAYVDHEGYNDMEFIAHPTTWLNGERWDDEYETPLRKETPGPGKREWVKSFHNIGEHWACQVGEFEEGCN
jgi:hypothetical protein